MKQYLAEIIYLSGSEHRKLFWMVMLFLATSVLDLAGIGLVAPYVALILDPQALEGALGEVVDTIGLPTEQETLLLILGGGLIGIFLVKSITSILANYIIIRFSQNRQVQLRVYLMEAYQNLPYTEYLRRNSSEYIHCIQQLTVQYSNSVLTPSLKMLSDGVVALVIVAFLAFANGLALSLLVALFGALVLGYDRLFRRNLRSYGENANKANTRVVKGVQEGIKGLKEIRILGKEQHFHQEVRLGAREFAKNSIKNQVISTAPRYLIELLLMVFVVAMVIITLSTGRSLQAIAPMLALFAVAALRLLPMVSTFSSGLTQLRYNRHAVSQLYYDIKQLEPATSIGQHVPSVVTEMSFNQLILDNIYYQYPGALGNALNGIDLEINAGESIGFIGCSGSGKTTLIDLFLGLLEPQTGNIKYNGIPLHEVMAEWRKQIAYLPQQVFLIDDTLRRNVALGIVDEYIDDEKLNEALNKAQLVEVVEQLPQGVDTLLGEHGVRLSGGQRQRVALARAFYHGRDVLVMDEATSALDNETEHEIVEEIQRLKGQKTLVVIAHRLSTVHHCDRIYKLNNGKIVNFGTPQEMLAIPNRQGKLTNENRVP